MLRRVSLVAAVSFIAMPAFAGVTISLNRTAKMVCAGGICQPTATNAVLNIGDLETLLAAGNVMVTTTGSGVQASNISISAPVTWTSANVLSLDAYQSIAVAGSISVAGAGGLSIAVNDGGTSGTLAFSDNAAVTFAALSSSLSINGVAYALEGNVKSLASAIAANPSGAYALANSYNANADGTYASAPVATTFTGSFEGLGNVISNLSVSNQQCCGNFSTGLFASIGSGGTVRDIGLAGTSIAVTASGSYFTGALAGENLGTIANSGASGTISDSVSILVGGLVGENGGTIDNAYAAVSVATGQKAQAGGLSGSNDGTIEGSYATGSVAGGSNTFDGGLVGYAHSGTITNSYATGNVSAADAGGLVGVNLGTISDSYAAGIPTPATGGYAGGLIAYDESPSRSLKRTYWDMTTSGIDNQSQGAGNIANDRGIMGETTTQLSAGRPLGFSGKIWRENPAINGGLPYLIANPPPQ